MNTGRQFTQDNEGFKNAIYKDSLGNLTVGYGTYLYEGRKLHTSILRLMFEVDYAEARKYVKRMFPDMKGVRVSALTDMMYALGMKKFLGFKNMIEALRNKEYKEAAHEVLSSLWAKQVGDRALKISYMLRFNRYMPEKNR